MFQMHVVVDRPLTPLSLGRISCRPMGQAPIVFTWQGPRGAVETDATGSETDEARPGRYRIIATDATDAVADLSLMVEPTCPRAILVTEYHTEPASSTHAHDGSVEAVGVGLDRVSRFLWTHGTQTSTPVLRNVPCGLYAAVPLDTPEDPFVHLCSPARVLPRAL